MACSFVLYPSLHSTTTKHERTRPFGHVLLCLALSPLPDTNEHTLWRVRSCYTPPSIPQRLNTTERAHLGAFSHAALSPLPDTNEHALWRARSCCTPPSISQRPNMTEHARLGAFCPCCWYFAPSSHSPCLEHQQCTLLGVLLVLSPFPHKTTNSIVGPHSLCSDHSLIFLKLDL